MRWSWGNMIEITLLWRRTVNLRTQQRSYRNTSSITGMSKEFDRKIRGRKSEDSLYPFGPLLLLLLPFSLSRAYRSRAPFLSQTHTEKYNNTQRQRARGGLRTTPRWNQQKHRMKFGWKLSELSSSNFHHAATHTLTYTRAHTHTGRCTGSTHTHWPVTQPVNGTNLGSTRQRRTHMRLRRPDGFSAPLCGAAQLVVMQSREAPPTSGRDGEGGHKGEEEEDCGFFVLLQ